MRLFLRQIAIGISFVLFAASAPGERSPESCSAADRGQICSGAPDLLGVSFVRATAAAAGCKRQIEDDETRGLANGVHLDAGGMTEGFRRLPRDEDVEAIKCLFGLLYPERANLGGAHLAEEAARESTYGEILPESFALLLAGSGLMGVAAEIGPGGDSFADLGSGTGKLPLQALLHGLHSSFGVELDKERHRFGAAALTALNAIGAPRPESKLTENESISEMTILPLGASLSLIAGDLLEVQIATRTIVFAASLCFPDWLLEAVVGKLQQELLPGAVFWSLKELPSNEHGGLVLVSKMSIASTWNAFTRLFVYLRVPDVALPPLAADIERNVWVGDVLAIVRNEFASALKSSSIERPTLFIDDLQHYLNSTGAPVERLLHAFGSFKFGDADDLCGCLPVKGLLSLSEVDFLAMMAHGVLPFNSTSRHPGCPSDWTCTAGDVIADTFFALEQKRLKCADEFGPSERCKAVEEADQTFGNMPGSSCMRMSDGRTLLHTAIVFSVSNIAEVALRDTGSGSLHCVDREGQNVVHRAVLATKGTFKWVLAAVRATGTTGQDILDALDYGGRSPLNLAFSAQGGVDKVKSMLAAGCSIAGLHAVDATGATPLYRAVLKGHESLLKLLLKHVSSEHLSHRFEKSPLVAATRKPGRLGARMIRAMVAHRADVNVRDTDVELTPLHHAVRHGHLEVVEALLDLGAKADIPARGGLLPRSLAQKEDIISLLDRHSSEQLVASDV